VSKNVTVDIRVYGWNKYPAPSVGLLVYEVHSWWFLSWEVYVTGVRGDVAGNIRVVLPKDQLYRFRFSWAFGPSKMEQISFKGMISDYYRMDVIMPK